MTPCTAFGHLKSTLCVLPAYACVQRKLPYFNTALFTRTFIPSVADALER
jgi:hypothetical protein